MEKLVRDLIPAIIEESGKQCNWRYVGGKTEHIELLIKKLEEEARELTAAISFDEVKEEAGDLFEVFNSLLTITGVSLEEARSSANKKCMSRGGFMSGIVLELDKR